jgi:hypothetical protein
MSDKPKPKILTRLRIDEVSAVDRGAGERCRIVLAKRDDSERLNLTDVFTGKITAAEALGIHVHKSAEGDEAEGLLAEPEPVVDNDGADGGVPKKSITFDTIDGTRMRFRSERALAEWLAIQQRIRKSTSEDQPTMSINLSEVVKAHGIGALCRHIVKSASSFGIDEHQLVDLATQDATRRYPSDTPPQAFAKLFMESAELREAIEIAKAAALQDAVTAEIEKDSRAACAELAKIGAERWPSLTKAQQFARAAETNSSLLNRAHRRPGPSTSFAYPAPVAKDLAAPVVDPKPIFVGDDVALDVDDPRKAVEQLKEQGRSRWPSASALEQFERALTDPENAELVRRAFARPTESSPPRR